MIVRALCLALASTALLAAPASATPRDPVIEPAKVSATARATALLTVPYFGRYSVDARSAHGVGLQLVDRMEGPGSIVGVPGEQDGRLDVFLDRGTYRIIVHPADGADGDVTLGVTRSEEQNREPMRLLVDKIVESELADHAYRSWWLDLPADQVVAVEAAGRHLADLRLWRDGNWLVDASPSCGTVEPVTGRPVKRCTLTRRLPKGLYRLSAYGGPGAPWTDESEDRRLHLQWGVPSQDGDGGRMVRRIGPFGIDRIRLDGSAREVRVVLPAVPQEGDISLSVDRYDAARPFAIGGRQGFITKKSRLPVARVRASLVDENVAVIQGPPGLTYTLEWFAPIGVRHQLGGQGRYYVTTMHGGDPDDRIDASGFFIRSMADDEMMVDSQALTLDREARYARRFELAGVTTMYLDVKQTGDYVLKADGVEMRIEPVMSSRPPEYETPEFVNDTLEIGLPTGPHVLTMRPATNGPVSIAELNIRSAAWNPLAGATPLGGETQRLPAVIQRAEVSLDHSQPLSLLRNAAGDAPVGLVMRALPLDPTAPVPFTLMPGESIALEAVARGAGTLRATSPDGKPLPVAIDGSGRDALRVEQGGFTVRITNDRETATVGALRLDLDAPDPSAVPLPTARLGALPVFPRLGADKADRADLQRNSEKTWRVAVESPALYILESTGLLQTSGVLRTRTRLNFARGEANGVGRNFRVARYLGQGDYQLTVATRGASRGRLGVQLTATPLIDGGDLRPDVPARRTVPAGRAVAYTFDIPEAGRYRLRIIGQGHTFRCRLEDGDGWPVARPDVQCDLTRAFEAGRYRVIGLPSSVETRRLTRLEKIDEARTFVGHGPHRLPARETVRHVWREPQSGDRVPDWWDFDLPADGEVSLRLSDEMVGELLRRDGASSERIERVTGGRETTLELPAGAYRLAVRCARRNDHVPYRVTLTPEALMVGGSRSIRPPFTVPIAMGAEGLVEIISEGDVDVRARLLNAAGESLAVADDRPDGWNFRIATRLTPGRYSLEVDAVDGGRGATRIAMRAPTAVDGAPLAFGEDRAIVPGIETHLLALPDVARSPALVATAKSVQNAGIALEARTGDGWRTLTSGTGPDVVIAARPVLGAPHRVRVWSLDQRGLPVTATVHAPTPIQPNGQEAARGVDARPGAGPRAVVALPSTMTPGLFAVKGDAGLLVCRAAGAGCEAASARPVAVSADGLVLVGAGRLSVRRLQVGPDPMGLTVGSSTVRVDLAPAAGARWLEVHSPIGRPAIWFDAPGVMGLGARAAAVYSDEAVDHGWLRSGDGSPLDVRVRSVAIEAAAAVELADDVDAVVEPGRAAVFTVRKRHTPRVTLDRGLAAVIDGAVTWAADGPTTVDPGSADRITVLNPGTEPARYRLSSADGNGRVTVLEAGEPVEWLATSAGEARIAVNMVAGAKVRIGGAVERATLVDANGGIVDGDGADAGRGGTLVVRHGPGPVLAWLATDARPGPTAARPGRPAATLKGNTRRPVTGDTTTLALKADGPSLVRLRLPAPFVASATVQDGAPVVAVRPAGGEAHIWLPTGAGTVQLRGLAGAPLFGVLDAHFAAPTDIGEGAGPEVLLAPGDARPFRFTVDRDAAIGIGVRAAADRVEATLLDARGVVLGEGPVQMPKLTAGTYLLLLRLPPDADPVTVQPALAGVKPPDDGPPEEVIRRYLQLSSAAD